MVRTCLVIGFMLLAGSAMHLGAAHLPQLLNDFQKTATDQARKPDSMPAAPDGGATIKKAEKVDTEVVQAGGDEAPATEFDVTRISRDGPSVFAGHAAPFQMLTLMENGKPIATVTADANGDWVIVTEHKFARVASQISFRVGALPVQAEAAVATSISQKSNEKQPTPTREASLSPATAVMKSFERLVSAAREEAKRKDSNEESASVQTRASAAEQGKGTPSRTELRPQLQAKAQPSLATAAPVVTEPTAPIQVPMTFAYDEATLTAEGHRATTLLLEYLQLKDFDTVTLTGHADERGMHEYNIDLSRQRLHTIARFLRDGGFKGQLDLIAKGETEPFSAVDRTKYSREDLWQLDRRVELHGAQ